MPANCGHHLSSQIWLNKNMTALMGPYFNLWPRIYGLYGSDSVAQIHSLTCSTRSLFLTSSLSPFTHSELVVLHHISLRKWKQQKRISSFSHHHHIYKLTWIYVRVTAASSLSPHFSIFFIFTDPEMKFSISCNCEPR